MTRLWLLPFVAMLLAACVSAPEQRPAALLQGERILALGVQSFRADDYANAATHFTRALAHYQGLDHQEGMLRARLNLAETALAVGNGAAAERHLLAAAPLAEGAAAQRVQLLRSSLALQQGRYAAAVELLTPMLEGAQRSEPLYRSALANRVEVALLADEPEAAAWVERYAAAVGGEGGTFTARLYRFRAELARRAGAHAAAAAALEQALALYKALPDRAGTAATLEAWGELLMEQQQWEAAADRLERALHIRLWLLARRHSAADLQRLAAVNEARGQPQRAAAQRRWAEIVAGDGRVDWGALQREVLPQ
ncbi:MAG: hypothetical protein Kow0096_01920 [Thiohalomonadaceae bacterium]